MLYGSRALGYGIKGPGPAPLHKPDPPPYSSVFQAEPLKHTTTIQVNRNGDIHNGKIPKAHAHHSLWPSKPASSLSTPYFATSYRDPKE